jgi:hypothetical protein
VASDAHSGVLHRVTDTGTASISTPCTFDRTNISIQLDVLPRKHTQASRLNISIDGQSYFSIYVPGSLDDDTAPIDVHPLALSSQSALTAGSIHAEVIWTEGLTLNVSLPAHLLGTEAPLSFTHIAARTGSSTSDVAIDNVVIVGATCGTALACVCRPDDVVAGNGDPYDNSGVNGAKLKILESYSEVTSPSAPGYLNDREIMCAHCVLQNRVGAVYTIFGSNVCPVDQVLLYSGYMAGTHTGTNGGGSNFLCLSPDIGVPGHTSSQNSNTQDLKRVEYSNTVPDMFGEMRKFDAVCSVCQVPDRGWALTVPGRQDCPTGFHLDYSGYLMSENWNGAHRMEHICVAAKASTAGRYISGTIVAHDFTTTSESVVVVVDGVDSTITFNNDLNDVNAAVAKLNAQLSSATATAVHNSIQIVSSSFGSSSSVSVRSTPNRAANANALAVFGTNGTSTDGKSGRGPLGRCGTDASDSQSATLHLIESAGSLPGYTDGLEITCAQCSTNVGPTYVRWGRKTCPLGSRLVYAGHAAGADGVGAVSNSGGGFNFQCLHQSAQYSETVVGQATTGARLYRVEYETSNKGLTQMWGLHGRSVGCAVCATAGATGTFMQPGLATCPSGWSMEYEGFIMSSPAAPSLANSQRTEYVCVDTAAEADTAGTGTKAAKLSPVEVYSDPRATDTASNALRDFSRYDPTSRTWSSGHELSCLVCSDPKSHIQCAPATPPLNASVTCTNGVAWGSFCHFSCSSGLVLAGPSTIRCTDTVATAATASAPEACDVPNGTSTDCTSGYVAGTVAEPSTTCPVECIFTPALAATPTVYSWTTEPSELQCVPSLAEATDVYTRYGADGCGKGSNDGVVYRGTMVGPGSPSNAASSYGSGANHLCLIDHPTDAIGFDVAKRSYGAINTAARNHESSTAGRVYETFYNTKVWAGVRDFGDLNADGDYTNDHPRLVSSHLLGVACVVCRRPRAAGVTLWGTSQCPAGSALAYDGFAGVGSAQRQASSTAQCMERLNPAVARAVCNNPRTACPTDGTPLTSFTFDEYSQMYGGQTAIFDFKDDKGIGGVSTSSGWGWKQWAANGLGHTCNKTIGQSSCLVHGVMTGEHSGVIERTTDSGSGSIWTDCAFETVKVAISMDILPRKAAQSTTLTITINSVLYATLTIPPVSETGSASVTVENGAKTSADDILCGTNANSADQIVWTSGWELEIELPSLPAGVVDVKFTHTGPGDIALDSLVVRGGICGTPSACTCKRGATQAYAEGAPRLRNPNRVSNGFGSIEPLQARGREGPAPGYLDGQEVACAHCFVEAANGAVYNHWGGRLCPEGHRTIGTGNMVGRPSDGSNKGGGIVQYLCLSADFTVLGSQEGYPAGVQEANTLAGAGLVRAEYIDDASLPLLAGKHHFDAACSVCQAPNRAFSLMVPGRKDCPSGFGLDYNGFLMSETNSPYTPAVAKPWGGPTQHICVARSFDGIASSTGGPLHPAGTQQNYLKSAGLALVEVDPVSGEATSMGYVPGREVTCATCSSNDGPTYVRWGRRSCPTSAVELYVGHAANGPGTPCAGANSVECRAGGYNFVCLHGAPQYDDQNEHWISVTRTGERLFRVEYSTRMSSLWQLWDLHNEDVPCAVCQSTHSLAVLMQPGSAQCPQAWSAEYTGFIMSEPQAGHRKTENVCVDEQPEKDTWSDSMYNEGLRLAPVEIRSVKHRDDAPTPGSFDVDVLEKKGYGNHAEIRCVVCTLPATTSPVCNMSAIPSVPNGTIACTNGGNKGSVCRLSCNTGFAATSTTVEAACLANAQWSTDTSELGCVAAATDASSVYVHWGSDECAPLETKLYSGIAVGPSWNDGGSGTNHLCVANDASSKGQVYTRSRGGAGSLAGAGGLAFAVEYWNQNVAPGGSQALGPRSPAATITEPTPTSAFDSWQDIKNFKMPCAVCEIPSASGFAVAGSDQCPSHSAKSYAGYVMIPDSASQFNTGRATHLCVEKQDTRVARTEECNPKVTCDGIEAKTAFWFDGVDTRSGFTAPVAQPRDFVQYYGTVGGTAPLHNGDGWLWTATLGSHSGVLQRTHDIGSGEISTNCRFQQPEIKIKLDILPRKFFQPSTFEISINGTAYVKVVIPGTTDTSEASAVEIALLSGAVSSTQSMSTGLSNSDIAWVNDWEISLSLPATLIGVEVPMTFTHIAAQQGTSTSDVALDNVIVSGGTCGTAFACTCRAGEHTARTAVPATTTTSGARVQLAETHGSDSADPTQAAAPGYWSGYEIACAHCSQRVAGAIYTHWGSALCPSGAIRLHSGYMVGGTTTPSDAISRGGANYLCLASGQARGVDGWSSAMQTGSGAAGAGAGVVKAEFGDSLPGWFHHERNKMVSCALCQAPRRAWALTIPGRQDCPSGFDVDYSGYLMASADHGGQPAASQSWTPARNAKTEYVCVGGIQELPPTDFLRGPSCSGTATDATATPSCADAFSVGSASTAGSSTGSAIASACPAGCTYNSVGRASLSVGDAVFTNDHLGVVSYPAADSLVAGVHIQADRYYDFGRSPIGRHGTTVAQRLAGYGRLLEMGGRNSRSPSNQDRGEDDGSIKLSGNDYKMSLVMMGQRSAGDATTCSDLATSCESTTKHTTSWKTAGMHESVQISMGGLLVGQRYRMQLLFYEFEGSGQSVPCNQVETSVLPSFATSGPWASYSTQTFNGVISARTACSGRGFDVLVDGALVVDEFSPQFEQVGRTTIEGSFENLGDQSDRAGAGSPGVFISYDFVAQNTTTVISLDGNNPGCLDVAHRACPPLDSNGNSRYAKRQAFINALTLEALAATDNMSVVPTVGTFAGGDASDGLDLSGSFVYAVIAGPRLPAALVASDPAETSRLYTTEIVQPSNHRGELPKKFGSASSPHGWYDGATGSKGEDFLMPGYTDGAEITCAQCSSNAGPTFVRWGRSDCPLGNTLLYRGLAAGGGSGRSTGQRGNSHQYHLDGNGYNYQCLHERPQYARIEAGLNTNGATRQGGARLFAVEYDTAKDGIGHDMWQMWHLHDHEVPCAVCQSNVSLASFMQPGSRECPTGWSQAYEGFIMSSPANGDPSRAYSRANSRGEYICVDGEATPSPSSDPADNSADTNDPSHDHWLMALSPVELGSPDVSGNRLNAELRCSVCLRPRPTVACPQLAAPAHGTVECTNGQAGASRCTFSCAGGFVLAGPSSVSCLDSGRWSTELSAISCVPSIVRPKDVYVRWGTDRCNGDQELFPGVQSRAVGAHYLDSGSGSNYMCLVPKEHAKERGVSSAHEGGGNVFSVEHEHTPTAGHSSSRAYDYAPASEYPFNFLGRPNSRARQEMVCAWCARPRAMGLIVWGTDKCPAAGVRAYDGFIQASQGQFRSTFQCVEKTMPAVARLPSLNPRIECNGSPMTLLQLANSWPNDWGLGTSTVTPPPAGYGSSYAWSWRNSHYGKQGVLQRSSSAGVGHANLMCESLTTAVTIQLDVWTMVQNGWLASAELEVYIGDVKYASLLVPPRPTSLTVPTTHAAYQGKHRCNVTVFESAVSNLEEIFTTSDYAWTEGWAISISLPAPLGSTQVSFVHRVLQPVAGTRATAPQVAIDNVRIEGGVCGTYEALTCKRGDKLGAAGNPLSATRNSGSRISPTETQEIDSAGYLDNIELPCAQCQIEATTGGLFELWGSQSCPMGTDRIGTAGGIMAGTTQGIVSPMAANEGGATNFICLGVGGQMSLGRFDTDEQAGSAIGAVTYGDGNALWFQAGAPVTCSTCQTPGRGWNMMVPGRSSCPSGFTLDYAGWLLSTRHAAAPVRTPSVSSTATQKAAYVCVYNDTVANSGVLSASKTSTRLYATETAGDVQGYPDHAELTCAQCSSNAGPTYVRWGRLSCPPAAKLLYAGVAAGSHYEAVGGGYNYQCLHPRPEVNQLSDSTPNALTARLYRVEYETSAKGLWQFWSLHDEDVPCAVCQSTGSLATIMQPGSPSCPAGWSTEYEGFIMSSPAGSFNAGTPPPPPPVMSGSQRSEYVCVDAEAEALPTIDSTYHPNSADNSILDHMNDAVNNSGAALLAPVEVRHTNPSQPSDILDGYTGYAELRCSRCSSPDPSIRCPGLASPGNGSVSCDNGNFYASRCTFSCFRGFQLHGLPMAVCMASGHWSSNTAVSCELPVQPATDVYVAWGGGACHALDDELYRGRAVGPRSADVGSGANRLCLNNEAGHDTTNRGENGGGQLVSTEFTTGAYENTDGFDSLARLKNFEMPCVVCSRARAVGFDLWGATTCPLDSVQAYSGFAMTDTTRRNSFQCVENLASVARTPCAPLYRCPKNAAEATIFRFDTAYPNDFVDATTGGVDSTWLFRDGLLKRVDNTGSASAHTMCKFSSVGVTITLDLLPIKDINAAKWELSINDVVYIALTIPGSSDNTRGSDATIETFAGATSDARVDEACVPTAVTSPVTDCATGFIPGTDTTPSVTCPVGCTYTAPRDKVIVTGLDSTDEVWKRAWTVNVTIPAVALGASVPLKFTHTNLAAATASAGVAIDNVRIEGGVCGTNLACMCSGCTEYAEAGDSTHNSESGMHVVEGFSANAIGPGYIKNGEISCARCEIAKRVGGVYRHWGKAACPAGHTTMYSGYMAGSQSSTASGGSQYLCLTAAATFAKFSAANQAGVDLYPVQYRGTDAPAQAGLENKEAACSVCVSSGRPYSLLIPGSNVCPLGFGMDFSGYLMSEKHSANRMDFICVSDQPEAAPGANQLPSSSAGLYPTEAAGALPFYVDGVELTCAQCSSTAGPTYVRWGKTSCPLAATLVYAGIAAGSHYRAAGGGYNFQCLHPRPKAKQFSDKANADTARLYRLEYETVNKGLWQLWHLHDEDVPCAVCQSTGSVGAMMQPGSSVCPAGWSSQYTGFIMSGPSQWSPPSGAQRSEYVCVDGEAEASPQSDPADNSARSPSGSQPAGFAALLSPVELQEEAGNTFFKHDRYAEVTCVVCSMPGQTCAVREAPGNGTISCDNGNRFGSRCHVKCDVGYALDAPIELWEASARSVCTAAGWSMPLPACLRAEVTNVESYVRFGAKTCAAGEQLMYSGRVIGARSGDRGSGSNRLCLPPSGTAVGTNDDLDGGAEAWSVEFDTSPYSSGGTVYAGFQRIASYDQYELACARCMRRSYGPGFHVWGTQKCPFESVRSVAGYVMADGSQRTDFACVDLTTPSLTFDNTANNGASLRLVESVPTPAEVGLPGYGHHLEITCSRCGFHNAPGAVYTRYGRRTCPKGHTMLGSGILAGSHSGDVGGGAQYLCLASAVELAQFVNTNQHPGVDMYRVQYQDNGALRSMVGKNYVDAVCSLCKAPGRQWQLTVAGRNDCPVGFTVDYSGWLMSEKSTGSYRTKHVCVDEQPQGIDGTERHVTSASLWPTETGDGIPGYVKDLEVSCAQCSSNEGPVYVRWGRRTCPEDATLMYAGAAAGAHFRDSGGGTDYVCLHSAPMYTDWDPRQNPTGSARLYYAEYAFGTAAQLSNLWKLNEKHVPCAVCQSRGAIATYMQPGSIICAAGWAKEYDGFVMSSPAHSSAANSAAGVNGGYRTEYVCVDRDAEPPIEEPGSDGYLGDVNRQRALFMPVEALADIAGNHLPGTVIGRELTCAVCAAPLPITIDKLSITSDNKYGSTRAKVGDSVTVKFTTSRSILVPTVVIHGKNATVAGGGNSYVARITIEEGDSEGFVAFAVTELMDAEVPGNGGDDVSSTTDDSSVLVDTTNPVATSISIVSDNEFDNQTSVYGSRIYLTFNVSEEVQRPGVSIAEIGAFVSAVELQHTAVLVASTAVPDGPIRVLVEYRDLAGNDGQFVTESSDGSSIVHDSVPPVVTTASITNNAVNSSESTNDDVIMLSFTTSEHVLFSRVFIAGLEASVAPAAGTNFVATSVCRSGMTEGLAAIKIDITDVAGQEGFANDTDDSSFTIVDLMEPVLTISSRSYTHISTNESISNADPVVFVFSVSDPTTSFTESDVFINACASDGGCCNPVWSAVSARQYQLACDANDGQIISVLVRQSTFTNLAGLHNAVPTAYSVHSDITPPSA